MARSAVVGLVPGIVLGTAIVAQVNPGWLRFWTFVVLLPLILPQAAGLPAGLLAVRDQRAVLGRAVAQMGISKGANLLLVLETRRGPF